MMASDSWKALPSSPLSENVRTSIVSFDIAIPSFAIFILPFALGGISDARIRTPSRPPALGEGRVVAIVGDVYRFLATGADGRQVCHLRGDRAAGRRAASAYPPAGGRELLCPRGRDHHHRERRLHRGRAGDVRQHADRQPAHVQERVDAGGSHVDLGRAAGLEEMFFEAGTALPPGSTTRRPADSGGDRTAPRRRAEYGSKSSRLPPTGRSSLSRHAPISTGCWASSARPGWS